MGQKSGQRVKNWPNKNQVASDLLRESTDSVIRAAEGIHQFCPPTYWGNPLADNFSIRPAEGIHRFCHRSYWGNPSILSSDLLRESTRVYISYRWLSFKYNCTYKTWSLGNVTHLDRMKPLKATSRFLARTWTIVLVPEYVSSCQHLFADHFPDAKLSWSNPIELGNWPKTTKFGIDTGPTRNRRVTRRRRKNYSDNGCSTAPSSGYLKSIENLAIILILYPGGSKERLA